MKIVKRTTRHLKSYNERTGEVTEGVEREEIFYEPSEGDVYEALPDDGRRNGSESRDKGKIWSAAVMPALLFFVIGIKFRTPFFYLTFLISSVLGICYTLYAISKGG